MFSAGEETDITIEDIPKNSGIFTAVLDFNDSDSRFYRRVLLSGSSPAVYDECIETPLYSYSD